MCKLQFPLSMNLNRRHSFIETTMRRTLFLILIFCSAHLFCFAQKKNLLADKLLVVLDIQDYYTTTALPEATSQKLIDSVNYVISLTSPDNVIYIKSIHKVLNISFSSPFVFVSHDTSAMRLDKRMNVVNDHIFTKEESNAFAVKTLNEFLKQKNIKEIIIIGLLAEQCVYESLVAGKELGYSMYMIPGAIIGKSIKSKDKVINKLLNKGIEIIDLKTLNNK